MNNTASNFNYKPMHYKITIFCLLLMFTSYGQQENWQDTYTISTYSKALKRCKSFLPNDSVDCSLPCYNYIGLFDLKFNVVVQYEDSITVPNEKRAKYIDRWTKTYWPNGEFQDLFKHQILVSTANEQLWIMIQEPTHEFYLAELQKGDYIELYIMFVGTIVIGTETQYIFVANDFLKL